jgi:hypothetical protein
MAIAQNLVSSAVVLRLITIPAEGDAAEGEGFGAGGLGWGVSGVGGAASGISTGSPTLQGRLTDRVYTVLRPFDPVVDSSGSSQFSSRPGTTGPIAELLKDEPIASTESLDEYFRRLALRTIRL